MNQLELQDIELGLRASVRLTVENAPLGDQAEWLARAWAYDMRWFRWRPAV